jgi:RHS repeat-associated protein
MQSIVTSASYLPSGPLDSLELGNGLTETRAFDARYHRDRITVAGGSTLLDWDYVTDDVGNVEAIADVLEPSNDRTYGYQDYQYFLTQGDGPWGGLDWTYDTIGNRLAEVRDGQPVNVYDYLENGAGGNLAQLETIQLGGGGTRAYLYDEVGNQTQVANGANVVEFTYDDASRLTRIERPSASASTSLLYDGRSFLRISEGSQPDTTGDGVFCDGFESGDTSAWPSGQGACAEVGVTRPVYSSEGMLHSLDRAVNVGSARADPYVLYFGSRPVASIELSSGAATFQYLSVDQLGTPVLATDSSGSSVWEGGFEPFGRDWQAGTPGGAQENGTFLRFPGQWFDKTWAAASLGAEAFYNVHRWYEFASGRYQRTDPLGPLIPSGVNHLYAFAAARPTVNRDLFGLAPFGLPFSAELGLHPDFLACAYCIFTRSGFGNRPQKWEESAWISIDEGPEGTEIGCNIWPATGEYGKQTFEGVVPSGLVAQVHVHPRDRGHRPMGADLSLARGQVLRSGRKVPVYVIHPLGGIWKYDPFTNRFRRIAKTRWQNAAKASLRERGCRPCTGIEQP